MELVFRISEDDSETHILVTTSSHHVALLGLDYIWETVKLQ
jgi:hypothetical protein